MDVSDDEEHQHMEKTDEQLVAERAATFKKLGIVPEDIVTLQDGLNALFKYLDEDGSGEIDEEEFNIGFGKLGMKKEKMKNLWALIDADGSGGVDIGELEDAMADASFVQIFGSISVFFAVCGAISMLLGWADFGLSSGTHQCLLRLDDGCSYTQTVLGFTDRLIGLVTGLLGLYLFWDVRLQQYKTEKAFMRDSIKTLLKILFPEAQLC